MPKYDALPPSLAPRGLSREAAAGYLGISASKFDQLVGERRMPAPKRIDARKVWDRSALDAAFDALPEEEEGNPWDVALGRTSASASRYRG